MVRADSVFEGSLLPIGDNCAKVLPSKKDEYSVYNNIIKSVIKKTCGYYKLEKIETKVTSFQEDSKANNEVAAKICIFVFRFPFLITKRHIPQKATQL